MAETPRKGPDAAPSFESHLEAAERAARELEGEALSLEAAIERYTEGVAHLAACRKILDAYTQRIVELTEGPDGGAVETPLRVGADGLVADREGAASSGDRAPDATSRADASAAPAPAASPRPRAKRRPASEGDDLPF